MFLCFFINIMKRALISVYNKAHLDKLVPFLERKRI